VKESCKALLEFQDNSRAIATLSSSHKPSTWHNKILIISIQVTKNIIIISKAQESSSSLSTGTKKKFWRREENQNQDRATRGSAHSSSGWIEAWGRDRRRVVYSLTYWTPIACESTWFVVSDQIRSHLLGEVLLKRHLTQKLSVHFFLFTFGIWSRVVCQVCKTALHFYIAIDMIKL